MRAGASDTLVTGPQRNLARRDLGRTEKLDRPGGEDGSVKDRSAH